MSKSFRILPNLTIYFKIQGCPKRKEKSKHLSGSRETAMKKKKNTERKWRANKEASGSYMTTR